MVKEVKPLLEFNNATVLKGNGQKVLNAISFNILEGESVAILGPNGAGKSSIIKLITREYYPMPLPKGCPMRIWGQERWNVFDLRSLLGIVTNDLQYICTRDITGFETVLSGFFNSIGLFKQRLTAQMKKKALAAIDFLDIGHLCQRKMNEMSSGEARRFLIARALVHNPKALVLDEPANTLDWQAVNKLSELLRKIAQQGTSIILVTHNLSDIIPEIDRTILIKEGRIYKDGRKELILTNTNIRNLFGAPVDIAVKDGYYYALRA